MNSGGESFIRGDLDAVNSTFLEIRKVGASTHAPEKKEAGGRQGKNCQVAPEDNFTKIGGGPLMAAAAP